MLNIKLFGSKTIILLINLYLFLTMYSVIASIDTELPRLYILIVLSVYLVFSSLRYLKHKIRNDIMSIIIFSLIISFLLIINSRFTLFTIREYLFFFFIYLLGSKLFSDKDIYEKLKIFTYKISIIFFIIYLMVFSYNLLFTNISPGNVVNSIYYCVLLMPIILEKSNKNIPLVFLVLLVSIFISGKRGAFLAIVIYFLIEYLINNIKKKKLIRAINNILISSVVLYITYQISVLLLDINFIERITSIFTETETGRIELYGFYIRQIENLDLQKIIFGNGMISTALIYKNVSVHNDFLEVFFRLGLFGLLIYAGIFYKIIRINKSYFNSKSKVFAVTTFLVLVTFSQILFVPSYIGYFALYFSMKNSINFSERARYE